MSTFDRRSEIIRYLKTQQRASTRTLSAAFDVSEVTIRHDLKVLAAQGWLKRVHGGAEISPAFLPEQPFRDRQRVHATAKAKIARMAADMVRPGETMLLDSSTTAYHLAVELKKLPHDLRIVTSNLHAVMALKDASCIEVIILGGVVRGETSSVVGSMAGEMLAGMHVDKGFFSASGVAIDRGLTDADIREVEIKRAMVRACHETIALLDSSKFGRQSFLTFASLADIDHVVSDDEIPDDFADAFSACGIHIHIAE